MIERISIEDYINKFNHIPIIDVRSPSEFEQGHIPTAINIPLFDNDERAAVGTVYKQNSKEAAIKLGYTYVNPKLKIFIDESQKVASDKIIAVHCWRGGMRSQSFAEHLHNNGFKTVYVVEKGYKAFRRYVLDFFKNEFKLKILGGYTGSGKTDILKQLAVKGEQVIDLEGLANHKGSAFGAIGEKSQPTVETFENNLFWQMNKLDLNRHIWVEDESLNIGKVVIPRPLFEQMHNRQVIFIDIPVKERAKYLVNTYGLFDKESLKLSILKIEKRLGYDRTKTAVTALENNNLQQVAEITLKYYDKAYLRGLGTRDKSKIITLKLKAVDAKKNTFELLKIFE
jgi:tRNA 2-selenouridine synthase